MLTSVRMLKWSEEVEIFGLWEKNVSGDVRQFYVWFIVQYFLPSSSESFHSFYKSYLPSITYMCILMRVVIEWDVNDEQEWK